MEVVRDSVAIIALIATIPFMAMTLPNDPVYGVKILLWGQVIASAICWIATIYVTAPLTNRSRWAYIADLIPYLIQVCIIIIPMYMLSMVISNVILLLIAQSIVGLSIYLLVNHLLRSQIQKDAIDYVMFRFKKKHQ